MFLCDEADILEPYPLVYDPDDESRLLLNPEARDPQLVAQLIGHIPSISAVSKDSLDLVDKRCFPLLNWIVSSNTSLILQIPPEKARQTKTKKRKKRKKVKKVKKLSNSSRL